MPTVDERLVVLHRRASLEVEQYNALRYTLERWGDGDAHRVVAVTSPAVGDGKTTTAINLAGVLAHRADARVLLVDADLRRPSVGTLLGVGRGDGVGLVDALLQPDRAMDTVVTSLPAFNLHLLLAGRPSDDPYELVRSPRLAGLLADARQQYDFIVIDTSPVLALPDARSLERLVDGFLLVVAAHRTPRRLVEEALNVLAPGKLVGVVFNRDDRPLSGYYGYYADAYGNGTSRHDTPKKGMRRWNASSFLD